MCEGGRGGLDVKGDSEVVPLSWAHGNYDAFLFYIRTSECGGTSPRPERHQQTAATAVDIGWDAV